MPLPAPISVDPPRNAMFIGDPGQYFGASLRPLKRFFGGSDSAISTNSHSPVWWTPRKLRNGETDVAVRRTAVSGLCAKQTDCRGGTQGLKVVIGEGMGAGFLKFVTAGSVILKDYVARCPQARNGERETRK